MFAAYFFSTFLRNKIDRVALSETSKFIRVIILQAWNPSKKIHRNTRHRLIRKKRNSHSTVRSCASNVCSLNIPYQPRAHSIVNRLSTPLLVRRFICIAEQQQQQQRYKCQSNTDAPNQYAAHIERIVRHPVGHKSRIYMGIQR